jgi:hypothetical protein
MHSKVFLKLRKPLKTLSSGQIYKKPKKTQTPPQKKKNTTGLFFFINPGFFQPCH